MSSRISLILTGIALIALFSVPVSASPVRGQFFGTTRVNALLAAIPVKTTAEGDAATSLQKVATKSQVGLNLGMAPNAVPKTNAELPSIANWSALQKVDKQIALSAKPLTLLSAKAMALGYDSSLPVR